MQALNSEFHHCQQTLYFMNYAADFYGYHAVADYKSRFHVTEKFGPLIFSALLRGIPAHSMLIADLQDISLGRV